MIGCIIANDVWIKLLPMLYLVRLIFYDIKIWFLRIAVPLGIANENWKCVNSEQFFTSVNFHNINKQIFLDYIITVTTYFLIFLLIWLLYLTIVETTSCRYYCKSHAFAPFAALSGVSTKILTKYGSVATLCGMDPISLLFCKYKVCKFVFPAKKVGMHPVNALAYNLIEFNHVKSWLN